MKTLQLSTIVLLLSSAFYSCTKDISKESSQETTSSLKAQSIMKADEKKPVLVGSQTANPVKVGDQVTVSYTAYDRVTNAEVTCGHVVIYQWINDTWTEVARGNAPTVSVPVFTATTAEDCAYRFRAGFDPGAGNDGGGCRGAYSGYGFDDVEQEEFCVDVRTSCVEDLTIEGRATAIPYVDVNGVAEPGVYEFTISFDLTSPEAMTDIKFQGGATSGGKFKHDITDLGDMEVVNDNNQNTVLKWKGGSLDACSKKTIFFKYKRKFECPTTDAIVTGEWTAKQGETLLADPVSVTYTCQ